MRIKRATEDDALAIATVHVRSWQGAYPGLIPQSYLDALTPEDRVGSWAQLLKEDRWPRSGVLVLVGPATGSIEGFAHICPTRDEDLDPVSTGEITSIYLAPGAWGSGNGRALMAAALDEMAKAGYSTASLWALDTNTRARRFYEIGGWREDGTTKLHDWGTFQCTDIRYVIDLPESPSGQ